MISTFLWEENVSLVVDISGHLLLVAGLRVVFGAVGAKVLHGSVGEDFVVDVWWELVLKDNKIL